MLSSGDVCQNSFWGRVWVSLDLAVSDFTFAMVRPLAQGHVTTLLHRRFEVGRDYLLSNIFRTISSFGVLLHFYGLVSFYISDYSNGKDTACRYHRINMYRNTEILNRYGCRLQGRYSFDECQNQNLDWYWTITYAYPPAWLQFETEIDL